MGNNFSDYKSLFELALVPGIGISRIKSLMEKFGSFDEILKTKIQFLSKVDGISEVLSRRIVERVDTEKIIFEQFEIANKLECKLTSLWDDDYPKLLKQIYDPPPFIFYKGNIDFGNLISIGIVGTRTPSQYGIQIAEKFAFELAENNILITSGLARGIDSIAHNATLKAGGKTIAVLGSGLDKIYPPENKNLAENIINSGGGIISEFFFKTFPDPKNFPRRNRIISGLSNGVLIIESSIKGGAIVTAEYAIEHNRNLYCIPGNLNSLTSNGTNFLIKNSSAKLVQSIEDILNEFSVSDKSKKEIKTEQLSLLEQMVFDKIESEPIHIDILADVLNISISEIHVHLLNLEFKNYIQQLPGKYFIRQY